jgi:hypothetical protein
MVKAEIWVRTNEDHYGTFDFNGSNKEIRKEINKKKKSSNICLEWT